MGALLVKQSCEKIGYAADKVGYLFGYGGKSFADLFLGGHCLSTVSVMERSFSLSSATSSFSI